MQLRDHYKKQAVKHSSQTQWKMHRKTRNNVSSEMRLAKKKYFCDKINECAQINNPRKSWSLINNLIEKKRKENLIILLTELHVNDAIISEDNLIAETFDDFFIHIGSKLTSEIDVQLPNENDAEGNTNNNNSLLRAHLSFLQLVKKFTPSYVISKKQNQLVLIRYPLVFSKYLLTSLHHR